MAAPPEEGQAAALNEEHVIVVLEKCCLELYKSPKGMQLLNADDHAMHLNKQGRDPSAARPDITHQVRVLFIIWSPSSSPSCAVSIDVVRQPFKQGWTSQGLFTYSR